MSAIVLMRQGYSITLLWNAFNSDWSLSAPAYIVAPVTRHGETVFHFFNSSVAHAFVLSLWHEVHGFGTPEDSVIAGVMKRKVWLAT